ncbi:MAG: acetamidase/formamidase family protein [Deltaproteobacteria bacterium]|jgi:amidase|nr:acetamidase/formamidase family protein [Deltaproteobacteria bacterium]
MIISSVVYAFDPKNSPVGKAKSGDTLVFETMDCFSNEISREDQLITTFDYNRANPAAGPIFVDGAEPGDVLVAEIKAIDLKAQGVVTTLPEVGPLCDIMQVRTKVLKVADGHTEFNGLKLPVKPMVGVIGVAPAQDPVPCGFPGAHGGNLDCKLMGVGARAYFPVRAPGALFQLGDLHAVMGDGELCGTGLEIAGKVTVTLTLIKKTPLDWPILETADQWHAMASSLDFGEALKAATRQLCALVSKAYGWDATDTFFYFSLWGDLAANQACQPCPVPMVLRVSIPKRADKPLIRA